MPEPRLTVQIEAALAGTQNIANQLGNIFKAAEKSIRDFSGAANSAFVNLGVQMTRALGAGKTDQLQAKLTGILQILLKLRDAAATKQTVALSTEDAQREIARLTNALTANKRALGDAQAAGVGGFANITGPIRETIAALEAQIATYRNVGAAGKAASKGNVMDAMALRDMLKEVGVEVTKANAKKLFAGAGTDLAQLDKILKEVVTIQQTAQRTQLRLDEAPVIASLNKISAGLAKLKGKDAVLEVKYEADIRTLEALKQKLPQFEAQIDGMIKARRSQHNAEMVQLYDKDAAAREAAALRSKEAVLRAKADEFRAMATMAEGDISKRKAELDRLRALEKAEFAKIAADRVEAMSKASSTPERKQVDTEFAAREAAARAQFEAQKYEVTQRYNQMAVDNGRKSIQSLIDFDRERAKAGGDSAALWEAEWAASVKRMREFGQGAGMTDAAIDAQILAAAKQRSAALVAERQRQLDQEVALINKAAGDQRQIEEDKFKAIISRLQQQKQQVGADQASIDAAIVQAAEARDAKLKAIDAKRADDERKKVQFAIAAEADITRAHLQGIGDRIGAFDAESTKIIAELRATGRYRTNLVENIEATVTKIQQDRAQERVHLIKTEQERMIRELTASSRAYVRAAKERGLAEGDTSRAVIRAVDEQIAKFQQLAQAGKITAQQAKELGQALRGANMGSIAGTDLAAQFTNMSTHLTAIGVQAGIAGMALTTAFREVMQPAVNLEHTLVAVKAIAEATTEQYKLMTDEALRLGQTTIFSAGQVAEGMKFLAQAGFTATQAIQAMSSVTAMAAAGEMDLAKATDIASGILRGYGKTVEELSGITDIMAKVVVDTNVEMTEIGESFKYVGPVANTAGVELREVAAAIGIVANAGIKGSMGGTALRQSLSALVSPTGVQEKALRDLGIQIKDSSGNFVGFISIIKQFRSIFDRMTDSADKAGIVMRIFGDRAGPAISALITNIDDLEELNTKLQDVSGSAQELAQERLDSVAGAMLRVTRSWETLKIALGAPTLEPAKKILVAISQVIGGVADQLTTLNAAVGENSAFGVLASTLNIIMQAMVGVAAIIGPLLIGFGLLAAGMAGLMRLGAASIEWGMGLSARWTELKVKADSLTSSIGMLNRTMAASKALATAPLGGTFFGTLGTLVGTTTRNLRGAASATKGFLQTFKSMSLPERGFAAFNLGVMGVHKGLTALSGLRTGVAALSRSVVGLFSTPIPQMILFTVAIEAVTKAWAAWQALRADQKAGSLDDALGHNKRNLEVATEAAKKYGDVVNKAFESKSIEEQKRALAELGAYWEILEKLRVARERLATLEGQSYKTTEERDEIEKLKIQILSFERVAKGRGLEIGKTFGLDVANNQLYTAQKRVLDLTEALRKMQSGDPGNPQIEKLRKDLDAAKMSAKAYYAAAFAEADRYSQGLIELEQIQNKATLLGGSNKSMFFVNLDADEAFYSQYGVKNEGEFRAKAEALNQVRLQLESELHKASAEMAEKTAKGRQPSDLRLKELNDQAKAWQDYFKEIEGGVSRMRSVINFKNSLIEDSSQKVVANLALEREAAKKWAQGWMMTTAKMTGSFSKLVDEIGAANKLGGQIDASQVADWITQTDALFGHLKDGINKGQDEIDSYMAKVADAKSKVSDLTKEFTEFRRQHELTMAELVAPSAADPLEKTVAALSRLKQEMGTGAALLDPNQLGGPQFAKAKEFFTKLYGEAKDAAKDLYTFEKQLFDQRLEQIKTGVKEEFELRKDTVDKILNDEKNAVDEIAAKRKDALDAEAEAAKDAVDMKYLPEENVLQNQAQRALKKVKFKIRAELDDEGLELGTEQYQQEFDRRLGFQEAYWAGERKNLQNQKEQEKAVIKDAADARKRELDRISEAEKLKLQQRADAEKRALDQQAVTETLDRVAAYDFGTPLLNTFRDAFVKVESLSSTTNEEMVRQAGELQTSLHTMMQDLFAKTGQAATGEIDNLNTAAAMWVDRATFLSGMFKQNIADAKAAGEAIATAFSKTEGINDPAQQAKIQAMIAGFREAMGSAEQINTYMSGALGNGAKTGEAASQLGTALADISAATAKQVAEFEKAKGVVTAAAEASKATIEMKVDVDTQQGLKDAMDRVNQWRDEVSGMFKQDPAEIAFKIVVGGKEMSITEFEAFIKQGEARLSNLGGQKTAPGMRTGGHLPGYGGGDTVPIWGEPGEFMVRKEAVKKYGTAFLSALNKMQLPNMMAVRNPMSALSPRGRSTYQTGGTISGRAGVMARYEVTFNVGGRAFTMFSTENNTAEELVEAFKRERMTSVQ